MMSTCRPRAEVSCWKSHTHTHWLASRIATNGSIKVNLIAGPLFSPRFYYILFFILQLFSTTSSFYSFIFFYSFLLLLYSFSISYSSCFLLLLFPRCLHESLRLETSTERKYTSCVFCIRFSGRPCLRSVPAYFPLYCRCSSVRELYAAFILHTYIHLYILICIYVLLQYCIWYTV